MNERMRAFDNKILHSHRPPYIKLKDLQIHIQVAAG